MTVMRDGDGARLLRHEFCSAPHRLGGKPLCYPVECCTLG